MGGNQSKQAKEETVLPASVEPSGGRSPIVNATLRLALVGPSGCGKSAFVNAIRGFGDDHEQAAQVNVNTLEPTGYGYPANPLVNFCDHPGYGSAKYPNLTTYWNTFQLEKYDGFLALTKDKEMSEFDIALAKKITESSKKFFVIRTHIDTYCKIEDSLQFNKKEKLEEMKDNIVENLSCDKEKVFFINSYDPLNWDFFRLSVAIMNADSVPQDTKNDLSEEYLADVTKVIGKNGVSGIEKLLKEKIDECEKQPIKFAITGECGTGKSSFINAIRGRRVRQWCAAVGVNETTKKPSEYKHPHNKMISFWDLPGIGTTNYPDLPTYCKMVDFKDYDTYLIFTATRFKQNDKELAKRVKSMGKSFFLIRTKIDNDCNNESRKKTFNEEEMLTKIKKECFKNVEDLVNSKNDIFLISNHNPEKWDFDRLVNAISDALPIVQRECLTLSLSNITRGCLKRKAKFFRAQAVAIAGASAATGAIPIPGVGAAVDLTLIYLAVTRFNKKFGLDDLPPENLNLMDKKIREIIKRYHFRVATEVLPTIATKTFGLMTGVEEVSKYIPLIGTFVAGSISFGMTLHYLNKTINELEEAALVVWDIKAKQSIEDGLKTTSTNK